MKYRYYISTLVFAFLCSIALPAYSQSKNYNVITFVQEYGSKTITAATDSVQLDKMPFSILYYSKRYDSQREKYHSLKVVVFKELGDTSILSIGKSVNDIPYFESTKEIVPGSSGLYDSFVVDSTAHHYLYYENEAERRVSRISIVNDLLELEWRISGVSIGDQDITLPELAISSLYFVFYADRNLNEVIDQGEIKIVKVNFR